MSSRAEIEAFIFKHISLLTPGDTQNAGLLKTRFAEMDDAAFNTMLDGFAAGTQCLPLIAPNFNKCKVTVENNFAVAKVLGHDFFKRIWLQDNAESPRYLSNEKYAIFTFPMRRQSQLQRKKMSAPEHNRSVDDFTGQATGASKGAKISYPELQVMAAHALDAPILELIKTRGGDATAFKASNASIMNTGGVSLKAILKMGTVTKANQTLHIVLMCMHLRSTLLKRK